MDKEKKFLRDKFLGIRSKLRFDVTNYSQGKGEYAQGPFGEFLNNRKKYKFKKNTYIAGVNFSDFELDVNPNDTTWESNGMRFDNGFFIGDEIGLLGNIISFYGWILSESEFFRKKAGYPKFWEGKSYQQYKELAIDLRNDFDEGNQIIEEVEKIPEGISKYYFNDTRWVAYDHFPHLILKINRGSGAAKDKLKATIIIAETQEAGFTYTDRKDKKAYHQTGVFAECLKHALVRSGKFTDADVEIDNNHKFLINNFKGENSTSQHLCGPYLSLLQRLISTYGPEKVLAELNDLKQTRNGVEIGIEANLVQYLQIKLGGDGSQKESLSKSGNRDGIPKIAAFFAQNETNNTKQEEFRKRVVDSAEYINYEDKIHNNRKVIVPQILTKDIAITPKEKDKLAVSTKDYWYDAKKDGADGFRMNSLLVEYKIYCSLMKAMEESKIDFAKALSVVESANRDVGYSRLEKNREDKNGCKFSVLFQDFCNQLEVKTGRVGGRDVGARTKRFTPEIIQNIVDKVESFMCEPWFADSSSPWRDKFKQVGDFKFQLPQNNLQI